MSPALTRRGLVLAAAAVLGVTVAGISAADQIWALYADLREVSAFGQVTS